MTTKKATEKEKASPTKPLNSKGLGAIPEKAPVEELTTAQAIQLYEQALKAMQVQKFDKAKPLFEKIISSGPRELADRARLHLNICVQQLSRSQAQFTSVEEHFDYAISLMNMGDFVTAREHLESMASENPLMDYIWYGLAALECLTGHTGDSLRHLGQAIQLNPQARFQARNDSDFKNMADDPRFTELVYPEGASV